MHSTSITVLGLYVTVAGFWANGGMLFAQSVHEQLDQPRWEVRLSSQERLIAQGAKGGELFSIRNLRTGRTRPAAELNKWYTHWNHDHLAFSPDGRWALWRDPEDGLVVASLHGKMKRWAWPDFGDEHDPIVWEADNRHFFEIQDSTNSHGQNPRDRLEVFDRDKPRERISKFLSVQEAQKLEKESD